LIPIVRWLKWLAGVAVLRVKIFLSDTLNSSMQRFTVESVFICITEVPSDFQTNSNGWLLPKQHFTWLIQHFTGLQTIVGLECCATKSIVKTLEMSA
jgi:hypothetical protein